MCALNRPPACLHCSVPAGKREAEATAAAATIAGGEGAKRRRTDEAAGMEVVEPPQVCMILRLMMKHEGMRA